MSHDLSEILGDWQFDPDDEPKNVRKIVGQDSHEKVQVRIRGGLLQWELDGRPDGSRPHGFESMLQYIEHELQRHIARFGNDSQFRVTPEQDEAAGAEMSDYYQRRLALFLLEDLERARADALHNLALMDLLKKYLRDPRLVMAHERYRPFVLMDRARAEAGLAVKSKQYSRAVELIEQALREITDFYREHQREDLITSSQELQVLRNIRLRLREQSDLPRSIDERLAQLREQLQHCVQEEDYEQAAKLRDQIRQTEAQQHTENTAHSSP